MIQIGGIVNTGMVAPNVILALVVGLLQIQTGAQIMETIPQKLAGLAHWRAAFAGR